ncbi:hypothetical protein BJV82DRAFT_624344 [Fennellomyces sp. T-0311]|nr:hypothetical protein BJV82DRAFT_624344 [Fennellomyces sp. T-0311]
MCPAVSPPYLNEGGVIDESLPIPLSPVMLDPAFNEGSVTTAPLPPLPPPPTQLPPPLNTYPRSNLLRERALRHPPRIPRLRRLNPQSANTAGDRPDYFVDLNRYNRYIQRSHNCVPGEKAVDLEDVCGIPISTRRTNGSGYMELDFEVLVDDGGQYSSSYGVENVLRNDSTVYCSGRSGAVNILLRYNGYAHSGIVSDRSCVVSHIVIKSPQYGFTAPCKDGLVFMSRHPIDVERSRIFDQFTREDFEQYMSHKSRFSSPEDDDTDPLAWFTLSKEKQMVIPIHDRSAKYILVKLLRSEFEADNIDLQYLGFVGYSGARYFSRGRLC